jgi:hypothetical protein
LNYKDKDSAWSKLNLQCHVEDPSQLAAKVKNMCGHQGCENLSHMSVLQTSSQVTLSGWQEAVKLEFIAKQACVILS